MLFVNGRFFYFNNDGKIYQYFIVKIRYPVIKKNALVLIIECTDMNWKTSNVNILCTSITRSSLWTSSNMIFQL